MAGPGEVWTSKLTRSLSVFSISLSSMMERNTEKRLLLEVNGSCSLRIWL